MKYTKVKSIGSLPCGWLYMSCVNQLVAFQNPDYTHRYGTESVLYRVAQSTVLPCTHKFLSYTMYVLYMHRFAHDSIYKNQARPQMSANHHIPGYNLHF
jgi:hypothetical protein